MRSPAWRADDAATVAFFTAAVAEHGDAPRALDWGSRASQHARFALLAEVGLRPGARLLDVGCGLAHLHDWLAEHHPTVHYTGLDATPALIEQARARCPEAELRVGDALGLGPERYDVVVASGLFYRRTHEPMAWLRAAVAAMWSVADEAVAFNTLSTWADAPEPGEFHADPLEVLAFARTLTPLVALRHDRHPADATVYLRRPA